MKTKKNQNLEVNEVVNNEVVNEVVNNEVTETNLDLNFKEEITEENCTKVFEEKSIIINETKEHKQILSYKYKEYISSLKGCLKNLKDMYETNENNVKKDIDYLCKVTEVKTEDFLNIDFVKTLYKVHTYTIKDSDKVLTLISEVKNVTDKTDFNKLSDKCLNNFGECLDIEKTEFTINGKRVYMLPIFKFTPNDIVKHLLKLDTYTIKIAMKKQAQKVLDRKAKKLAKKLAKNAQKEPQTEVQTEVQSNN